MLRDVLSLMIAKKTEYLFELRNVVLITLCFPSWYVVFERVVFERVVFERVVFERVVVNSSTWCSSASSSASTRIESTSLSHQNINCITHLYH